MATKKKVPTEKPTPPSLDELFDRITEKPTKAARAALVARLRQERSDWQEKQEKKRDAKEK